MSQRASRRPRWEAWAEAETAKVGWAAAEEATASAE